MSKHKTQTNDEMRQTLRDAGARVGGNKEELQERVNNLRRLGKRPEKWLQAKDRKALTDALKSAGLNSSGSNQDLRKRVLDLGKVSSATNTRKRRVAREEMGDQDENTRQRRVKTVKVDIKDENNDKDVRDEFNVPVKQQQPRSDEVAGPPSKTSYTYWGNIPVDEQKNSFSRPLQNTSSQALGFNGEASLGSSRRGPVSVAPGMGCGPSHTNQPQPRGLSSGEGIPGFSFPRAQGTRTFSQGPQHQFSAFRVEKSQAQLRRGSKAPGTSAPQGGLEPPKPRRQHEAMETIWPAPTVSSFSESYDAPPTESRSWLGAQNTTGFTPARQDGQAFLHPETPSWSDFVKMSRRIELLEIQFQELQRELEQVKANRA